MKQDKFPREYFICRRCGETWSRERPAVAAPLDLACPACGINYRNHARDEKSGIPILGPDNLPLPAIEYVEGAERVKAWHRLYLEQKKQLYGQARVGSEVRIQAWAFDVMKPYLTFAEFFCWLTLARHCNEAGISTIGQEQLSFRMSARVDVDRMRRGSRRAASVMVRRLASIWIYWSTREGHEDFRPLVAIERRGRACSYHVLRELPAGAHQIKVGGPPRRLQEAVGQSPRKGT